MDNKNNNITLFINSLRGGGAERICVTLANGLVARGWEVTIVVLNLHNAILAEELDKGIVFKNLNIKHARGAFFKILHFLKKNRVEKIVTFNHQISVILVLLRWVFKLNFIIVARNISHLSQKYKEEKSVWHRYFVDRWVKFLYKFVDRVIAQSQGMRTDLISNYHIVPEKIFVINNPLNPVIERQAQETFCSWEEKQDYLLCVGRLEKVKAFDYAIEAFAKIHKDFPEMRLKIIGEGSEREYLERFTKQLKLEEFVDFEGYKKDLALYYLSAKATLLTSLYEGFPNVLVESVAFGTPVVAFDCESGPAEIINNDVNGYIVEYQNIDILGEAINKTLSRHWDTKAIRQSVEPYRDHFIIDRYCEIFDFQLMQNNCKRY
ncbi:MAG: glycosyltransferase [bacterium]